MRKAGRKSYKEEIQAIRHLSALTPTYFDFLKEMLDPKSEKADRKWAGEQISKMVVKTIPQDVTSGGETLPTPILYVQSDNSNKQDNADDQEGQSSAGGNVGEQDNIDSTVPDSESSVG